MPTLGMGCGPASRYPRVINTAQPILILPGSAGFPCPALRAVVHLLNDPAQRRVNLGSLLRGHGIDQLLGMVIHLSAARAHHRSLFLWHDLLQTAAIIRSLAFATARLYDRR